jgi:hypothetical protein
MKKILGRAYQKLHVTTTLFINLILGYRLTPENRNDSPCLPGAHGQPKQLL